MKENGVGRLVVGAGTALAITKSVISIVVATVTIVFMRTGRALPPHL